MNKRGARPQFLLEGEKAATSHFLWLDSAWPLTLVDVLSQSGSWIYAACNHKDAPSIMPNRRAAFSAPLTLLLMLPQAASAQTVTSLQVAPLVVEVGVGQSVSLLVTAYDNRGNVVPAAQFLWSSIAPNVARVDFSPATPNIATVFGVSEGATRLNVRVGTIEESVTVTVTRGCGVAGTGDPTQLPVVPNPIQLLLTESMALETRFLRADGAAAACRRVAWRSLRQEVANVNQQGVVIGITNGSGIIEANAGPGLVDRVIVTVTTEEFRFRRDLVSLPPTESESLVVVVPSQNNRPITNAELQWATTDPNVAFVSTSGVVTGVTAGTTEVIARGFGTVVRMPVIVHRPVEYLEVLPRPDEGPVLIPLSGSVVFDVQMLDRDEVVIEEARPSWIIEDRTIISIDRATARVTGRKMGTTRLIARGRGVEATWTVEVMGPNIAIDQQHVGLSKGEQASLDASFVDNAGNDLGDASDLTWTSVAPDVATVDANGTVTAAGFGTVQIVAVTDWGEADTTDVYVQGRILFTGYDAESQPDLYAFDPDSVMVIAQITDDAWTETAGSFSPDGSRIAYVTNSTGSETGAQTQKIVVMYADGSNQVRLTSTPDSVMEDWPAWTPDGGQIVYSAGGDLFIINADGTDPRQLTSGPTRDNQPAVSPDGSTIAYQVNSDIYIMSLDGQQQRPVRETRELEMIPGWFPDGRLAYVSQQGGRRNQSRTVMSLDLDTGTPAQVTPDGVSVWEYTISADGNTVAFTVQASGRRSVRTLFLMQLSGANSGVPMLVPAVPPVAQFFFPSFKR